MDRQASIMKIINGYGEITKYIEKDYGSCTLPFLSLSSIYKPSFISIPFVLSKILTGQATIMKNG